MLNQVLVTASYLATTIDNLKIITSFPYERLSTQITKSKVFQAKMLAIKT